MKLFIIIILIFSPVYLLVSQVGIGTTTPHTSALLDIESTDKGFLPPRMTTSERDEINGGDFAEGLMIFNEDINCLEYYNSSAWINLCETTTPIVIPSLPANLTLEADKVIYIASIYDENYTPYVASNKIATTGTEDPLDDNGLETLIDVPGTLNTTTGRTVKIPYHVSSGSVNLPAFSQLKTVISNHVQGADPNSNVGGGLPVKVLFSYEEHLGLEGSGTITATVKAVSTTLNAVKLDINAGIGTDLGILLAEFTIATDDNGGTGFVRLKDIAGIPDRMMGLTDNAGDDDSHNFLYLPMVSATSGQTWLNKNLGSAASSINKANELGTGCTFSFAQDASSMTDHCSYGSLFQWGRRADGHELIKYTSSTSGSGINGQQSGKEVTNVPDHSKFIINTIDTC